MLTFSKFFKGIKFICHCKTSINQDIVSLWQDNNHYYGYYRFSGLRPITDDLFNKMLEYKV